MGEIDGYLDELLARFDGRPAYIAVGHVARSQHRASRNGRITITSYLRMEPTKANTQQAVAELVWHLAGAGMSIEEIADELARHPNGIGAKYAKRLLAEVARCFNKWKTHRLTAVTGKVAGARSATGPPGVTVATAAVIRLAQIQ